MHVQAPQKHSDALTQMIIPFSHTKDQKGHYKACNGAKCKGFIEFHPKEGKVQEVFKRGSHIHKGGHKRGICQTGSYSSKFA
ncbi:hypothetical protein H5410_031048 [Solanum commersonii]|uniref:Uncharacterized protein n=1 Tax=Solanum commersonii TaxID=4109 RepID=A0A9J5YL55_SOLCO|nr:hypothetical protein H5410_031048 [Solanum commersonii]